MVDTKPSTCYIQNKNIIHSIHFRSGHTTLIQDKIYHKNELNTIMKSHILSQKLKRKIFLEVANGNDILQSFDTFNPLYTIILIVSSILSFNDIKRNRQMLKIQSKSTNLKYRWFDFCLLVVVLTLMRNVQNAI